MADNIDLDVSGIMDDTETLDAAADRLFAEVLAVASGQADGRRTARPSRVRDSSPQSHDLTESRARDAREHSRQPGRLDARLTVAGAASGGYPLGRSARCCSSRRRSTTSIGRSSASSSRHCSRSSAGPRSTTPTSSSRSSSPTRSGCCSPAGDRSASARGIGFIDRDRASGASRRWRTPRRRSFGAGVAAMLARVRAGLHGVGRRVHRARASCSGSARRATFRRRSRPSPSGSRRRSARSRPGIFNSGTNIGALRHAARRAVDHAAPGAGTGRSSPPARSASCGCCSGCRSTGAPETHPRVGAAELAYIRSDPPDPPTHDRRGARCCRIGRRGRSRSASS